jgi:hypothetical protein
MRFTYDLPSLGRGCLLALALLPAACVSGKSAPPPGNTTPPGSQPEPGNTPGADAGAPPKFEPLPTQAYVGKVKSVLTGLAPTDDEVRAVAADGKALAGLVDVWTATPEFRARMLGFFQQAFQQTQTDLNDYVDLFGGVKPDAWKNAPLLLKSLEESFARTALALIDEKRPWTEVATTDRFMLNPPLMVVLAALDALPHDDDNKLVRAGVWPLQEFPGLTLVRTNNPDPVTGVSTPIPYAETIDPKSPNFMRFYDPKPYEKDDKPQCKEPQTVMGPQALLGLLDLMWGSRPGACGSTDTLFTPEDFGAWRMVKIRRPAAGEKRTLFWDLAHLRDPATTELVLATPRVGFETTLAFFANWPTNASNASRVTTNQALIVGLGRSFDDRTTTVQLTETSVETAHIQPNTTCFACHQSLDPMRDFFRQSYNISYFPQLAPQKVPAVATFRIDGTDPVMGNGIATFARAVADHPRFAGAWTQKLCQLANSESCNEADPEFTRVSNAFAASKFDFRALVRELYSSPLVTFAAKPKGTPATEPVISIARREALCTLLQNRLQIPDVCDLESARKMSTRRNLALSIPGAGYSRGDDAPLLPHDPSLFFASAGDNLCYQVAALVVDAGAKSRYSSKRAPEAIADFVQTVMALPPSDPRAAPMRQLLEEHQSQAAAKAATPTDALRSTFMVACTSPFTLSLGL